MVVPPRLWLNRNALDRRVFLQHAAGLSGAPSPWPGGIVGGILHIGLFFLPELMLLVVGGKP
jgi:hypothetical protein